MELDVSPADKIDNDMEYTENSTDSKYTPCKNDQYSIIRIPEDGEKSSKHSSRKQSKRRKKNSSHSRPLPRIIVKPLPPPPPPENREWTAATSFSESSSNSSRPSTMREVLASIPGFCMKPRKRSSKKLSTAAQLQQTREGCIDLETPDSILVNTNIRALLNKHTFSLLPPLYQYKLGQLLPSVDRLSPSGRLNSSSLNNEFFARACLQWQDSLSGGELTPENQQRMKTEAEKEKSKIDPWKLKHFEPIWGEKCRKDKSSISLNSDRPSLKTTIKLRPTASITSSSTVPKIKKSKSGSSKRMRSVGAVTRSSARADDVIEEPLSVCSKQSAPVPDLLPLKQSKSHNHANYEEYPVDFTFSDSSSTQRMDDSLSTTPVDPLLLPDGDSDRNEVKQELDISVVTIEETSKDCEEDKAIDSDSNLNESSKRSNNENSEYTMAKRIKFEEDYEMHNSNYMVHNTEVANHYSDIETNYSNEQVCPNDELLYAGQDHGDTNSEDSKATASGYEYDARSESSMSSLKVDMNVNNMNVSESTGATESIPYDNIVTEVEDTPEVDKGNSDSVICEAQEPYVEQYQECVKSDTDVESPQHCKETVVEQEQAVCQSYNQEVDAVAPEVQSHLKDDVMNSPKCEKESLPQNMSQNYYDEHFKDAESFILETSLSILTSQSEDVKYSSHPNLMELSSYMSETNVTAVVTMPLTQNSSIPMMEVTNTSIVSYPDDNMKDAAKPKASAVSWKNDNDWTNNENVMSLHPFSSLNTESTKYVSEDSKTSMDDINMNDENCMYKEDRDANFNMESSNSSESCQSIKDSSKQELDAATSLISSTAVTNPPVNSTTITQGIWARSKKSKIGKESNRSRSSNKVPPGTVNLERSYQICQAAIQNSPNRDALRGQLRPPPALLTRPARSVRPPPPPPPVLVRQLPVSVMPHNEMNENRSNNVGQYILVQRTPNVAPRASSAPPTRLWGFSGHVQTILHSLIGRVRCPWPIGGRVSLVLPDKSTLTYDLYEPVGNEHEDDVTVAICPGIGNTSESVYIRTYVHYSQCHGYRCAVLNHIGALNSVPVTGNRIFSYGHTDDYNYMVENLLERYPNTKLILVGFSLGGNLISKYLGEDRKRPTNIIGGISICQGYNAIDTMVYLLQWQNFRRFYLYIMTDNYRNIITRHKRMLLSPEMKNRYSLDEKQIVSAGTLPDLDEAYSRKVYGFDSVADLYKWSSSAFYLHNIKTPMIFVNARDDPIVPEPLLPIVREFVSSHDKAMYLELAHGGHLGFYEGGLVYANPVNWLDRALVGLAGGLLMAHNKCSHKDVAASVDCIPSDDEPDLIKSATIVYRDPLEKVPQLAY